MSNDHVEARGAIDLTRLGQIVLVLQGGGALGAYQGGVYQALSEAGIEPDWVIGTSIGAINAAIIAGNRPADRLERLRAFWDQVQIGPLARLLVKFPWWGGMLSNGLTMMGGVQGFFTPNPLSFLGLAPATLDLNLGMTPETAGFYSTAPLERTLAELVDLDVLAERTVRLTVGAANVRTAEMHYFDSRDEPLTLRHVVASGALPPAFPAVAIDGELYWDGGIISNTPVEAVFDDNPRRSGLVFAVHMWRPSGPDPDSIVRVLGRQKDLQYASRAKSHIARQKQIHKLRHIIAELSARLPEDMRTDAWCRDLAAYGCTTTMHVVRLVAPPLAGEDHSKDIDFSPEGVRCRWEAGYADTRHVLEQRPWMAEVDPLEGFVLHETEAGHVMSHS
jgi:NTE family protein